MTFAGTPNGVLELRLGQPDKLSATGLASGTYTSTITAVGPVIAGQPYALQWISCDDTDSAAPSTGNVGANTATFNIEAGEKVTCRFHLKAVEPEEPEPPGLSCICPLEGSWSVSNLPGTMVCTGTAGFTLPLAASTQTGTLGVYNGCQSLQITNFDDDYADVPMQRVPGECGYKGVAEGVPMENRFNLDVQNEEFLIGSLRMEIVQQGTTCIMTRDFEVRFID